MNVYRNELKEKSHNPTQSKILLRNHKMINNLSKFNANSNNKILNTGSLMYPNIQLTQGSKITISGLNY
jgi:hypothetical protein